MTETMGSSDQETAIGHFMLAAWGQLLIRPIGATPCPVVNSCVVCTYMYLGIVTALCVGEERKRDHEP